MEETRQYLVNVTFEPRAMEMGPSYKEICVDIVMPNKVWSAAEINNYIKIDVEAQSQQIANVVLRSGREIPYRDYYPTFKINRITRL